MRGRGWCGVLVLTIAGLAVAGGLTALLLGFFLARDWLVVDRGAVHMGTGLGRALANLSRVVLGFRPDNDVAELLAAALATGAVTFGVGVLLGRWSAGR